MSPQVVTTSAGPVEYDEHGTGDPVLVLHGSPGGIDQAALMARFLPAERIRAITVSRPGYLGTPLGDHPGWDGQADLLAALLDHLGVERCTVLAWSGGGPPAYRLAVRHPERVAAIIAVAAVSTEVSIPAPSAADRFMFGTRPGAAMLRTLVARQPRQVVQSTLAHEGSLEPAELAPLVDLVMADDVQRSFVLDLAPTVSTGGTRKPGWTVEKSLFPQPDSLELERVACPVLLVHGDADSDAPPEQSTFALAHLPRAELVTMAHGTHLSFWVHEDATTVQARALAFIAEHARAAG